MDEVHHIHHSDAATSGMSAVMMVVLLVALVGLALMTFFALKGFPRTTTPADNTVDVGIEGQLDLPKSQPTPDSY